MLFVQALFIKIEMHIELCLNLMYIKYVLWRHHMTRLTVTLDETILEEAKAILKTRTKKDTIETALKEVIKQKHRKKALENCGKIELEFTQDDLESYRELK